VLSQNECVSKVFSANSCVCVPVFACCKLTSTLVKLKGDDIITAAALGSTIAYIIAILVFVSFHTIY
jgi:hypothetical protein